MKCKVCVGDGYCTDCYGGDPKPSECKTCGGSGIVETSEPVVIDETSELTPEMLDKLAKVKLPESENIEFSHTPAEPECRQCHGKGSYTVHISTTENPTGWDETCDCNHQIIVYGASPTEPADMQSQQAHDKGYAKKTAEIEHEPATCPACGNEQNLLSYVGCPDSFHEPADELGTNYEIHRFLKEGRQGMTMERAEQRLQALITREIERELKAVLEARACTKGLTCSTHQAHNPIENIILRIEQLKKGGSE